MPKKKAVVIQPSAIERSDTYGDFVPDAPVKIIGGLFQGKHASWVFLCHKRNSVSGNEWFDLQDKKTGEIRAIATENVRLIAQRRKKRTRK